MMERLRISEVLIILCTIMFCIPCLLALNVRTKSFYIDISASRSEVFSCLVSCLDINCGGVSVGENGSCVFYTSEEWHPEIVHASQMVSSSVFISLQDLHL